MKINGYVIVEQARYAQYHCASTNEQKTLQTKGIYYSGIGRLWGGSIKGNPTSDILNDINHAENNYSLTLMYDLFDDHVAAQRVLSYINTQNKISPKYECIGVYCQTLNEVLGCKNSNLNTRLGVDIDIAGLFPIKEELFAALLDNRFIEDFRPFLKQLNKYGLFEKIDDAKAFLKVYAAKQEEVGLELIEDMNAVEFVELFM